MGGVHQLPARIQRQRITQPFNRALARVKTRFALLLNPDCSIRPEDVRRLVDAAQTFPEASILGPQILDGKGRPEVNYRWAANRWKSAGPAAEGPACVGFIVPPVS